MKIKKAAFGAGCFWHVEEEFRKLRVKTTVGYMGGNTEDPSYKDVCKGDTGHIESVSFNREKGLKSGRGKNLSKNKVFWRFQKLCLLQVFVI